MAPQKQRFLPARVSRLLAGLGEVSLPGEDDTEPDFAAVAELVSALYHVEFHGREKAVSECWDRAVDQGDEEAAAELNERLVRMLEDSNYREMTTEEIEDAVTRELLLPLRLEVDLDDYRELLIYHRGSRLDEVEARKWDGIRREQRQVTIDRRLVVHSQVREAEWFDQRGIDPAKRGLVPGRIDLKHFRDVPRANIKTLLPSVQVRFRLVDSLLFGIPAVASGVVVLTTKLITTLGLIFLLVGAWLGLRSTEPKLDQAALVALLGGLAALGGFLVRQWTKLKNRRVRYLKVLSEHLYYHTIGNGSDVVHALLYSAEQQEVAEVLLAYRFLLAAPEGRRPAELDAQIERWLCDTTGIEIDFDVDDAVAKLRGLELAESRADGVLAARPVAETRAELLRRWRTLFEDGSEDGRGAVVPVTKQRG